MNLPKDYFGFFPVVEGKGADNEVHALIRQGEGTTIALVEGDGKSNPKARLDSARFLDHRQVAVYAYYPDPPEEVGEGKSKMTRAASEIEDKAARAEPFELLQEQPVCESEHEPKAEAGVSPSSGAVAQARKARLSWEARRAEPGEEQNTPDTNQGAHEHLFIQALSPLSVRWGFFREARF